MQLCGAQQNMSNWDYCCSQNHEPHRPDVHLLLIPWSGAPILGTHKKMTEIDEQELHEVLRLKHHSHGLKNQYFGEFPLFRDQGAILYFQRGKRNFGSNWVQLPWRFYERLSASAS